MAAFELYLGRIAMAHGFCHVELATPDLASAKEFYGGMFGWTFVDQDMGAAGIYSTFLPVSGPPGGGMYQMPGAPPAWLAYVHVEDIDEATAKAKKLGAQVTRDVTEIPHVGWMSVLIDPTGAVIALFEPAPQPAAAS